MLLEHLVLHRQMSVMVWREPVELLPYNRLVLLSTRLPQVVSVFRCLSILDVVSGVLYVSDRAARRCPVAPEPPQATFSPGAPSYSRSVSTWITATHSRSRARAPCTNSSTSSPQMSSSHNSIRPTAPYRNTPSSPAENSGSPEQRTSREFSAGELGVDPGPLLGVEIAISNG